MIMIQFVPCTVHEAHAWNGWMGLLRMVIMNYVYVTLFQEKTNQMADKAKKCGSVCQGIMPRGSVIYSSLLYIFLNKLSNISFSAYSFSFNVLPILNFVGWSANDDYCSRSCWCCYECNWDEQNEPIKVLLGLFSLSHSHCLFPFWFFCFLFWSCFDCGIGATVRFFCCN